MQVKKNVPEAKLERVRVLEQEIEKHQREIIRLRREIKLIKDVFEEDKYQII